MNSNSMSVLKPISKNVQYKPIAIELLRDLNLTDLERPCGRKAFAITNQNTTNQNLKNKNVELIKSSEEPRKNRTDQGISKIEHIRKMINRFLFEKKVEIKEVLRRTEQKELTEALGITIVELNQLLFTTPKHSLIKKVNLPLIKLYLATKFEYQQQ